MPASTNRSTLPNPPPDRQPGRVTPGQAAALLLMSTERLRQLARTGHIPKAEAGTYPLVGVVQGYIRFMRDDDRRSSRIAAESGLKAARQDEIEMRTAERRRNLVGRPEAELAMETVVELITDGLDGFAARVTNDGPTRCEIERHLHSAIHRIEDQLDAGRVALATGGASPGALDSRETN